MFDEPPRHEINIQEVTIARLLPRSFQHPLAAIRVKTVVNQYEHGLTRNISENQGNVSTDSFRRVIAVNEDEVYRDSAGI
jgi:hypothetical protein